MKRWFLTWLTSLIVAGIVLGGQFPVAVKQVADAVNPLLTTSLILFLMSFSLETQQIQAALRSPLSVVLGSLLNFVLAPSLALALMPWQSLQDFRYGLLVAGVVPCTMATASVWTRKAHGNDAISLLVTLTTNVASVVTVPFWLALAMSYFPLTANNGGAGSSTLAPMTAGTILDMRQTAMELICGVLVPIFLGQLGRQFRVLNSLANRYKQQMSVASQVLVLVMVWTAAAKGGVRLSQTQLEISLFHILAVWTGVIVVHVVTLYVGLYSARGLGMDRGSQIAVAFAGSQKTLPVGLLVSEALSRQLGLSFVVFPMLMYHASQLFLDTLIVEQFLAEELALTDKSPHSPPPDEKTP